MELLDRRRVCRKHITVGSPKHSGVVERHISMAVEFAMASGLKTPRLIGDVMLPQTGRLWSKACK